ncbi:MAG: hypothetical protein H8E73_04440 [Planctomycetes bacterium]|nr:hypothetical protein [Planctomycetota bacterium]
METEDKVHPSFTTNAHSGSVTVVEEQPKVEESVETKVEAPSNVEVEEVVVEPMIDVPMEVETEPEDIVSLDSFDRPYNHTITEEDFLKMSPEDQREVIGAVMAGARELKMGVMGCYQETQELIKAGDYFAAEEKVSEILDASIAYDGGEGTLTLSRVIGLNSQNDSLGIMSQIYGAANSTDAKAQVDERMKEIQESMKTLRERQGTSYSMYLNR